MLPIYGLTVLGLAASAAADYYIDNANNTVTYAPSGTSWQTFSFANKNLTFALSNGSYNVVDSSKCYDQNYALAACTVENNCQITFPFTGSGVSVYVMHAGFQGITASLTIDGGPSVTATLPPPAPPSYQTPNVSLFNIQFLQSTVHTATINLLDWENGATSLYFDYALVNESHVELSASPSLSPPFSSLPAKNPAVNLTTSAMPQSSTTQPTITSSTSPTTSSAFIGSTYTSEATSAVSNTESSVNLGVVVGGACGGLAVLIAIVTAIIFLKKHKSRHVKLEESRRPDPFPVTPALTPEQIVSLRVQPLTNEKAGIRLAPCDAAVYQLPRQSDDDSSDFHILSTADNIGRVPDATARQSSINTFSHDDLVIDCRREDRPLLSSLRGSVARNSTPPTTPPADSAPPGYKTQEGSIASNPPL